MISILLLIGCNEDGRQHRSLEGNNEGTHSIESRELTWLPHDPNPIGQGLTNQELVKRYDKMLSQGPKLSPAHLEYNCNKDKVAINITVQEYEGESGKGTFM